MRWKAAEALGRSEDSRAVEPLLETLDDADWSVRMKVVEALGAFAEQRVITALTPMLEAPQPDVREQAVQALKRLRTEAIDVLAVELQHDNPERREGVIEVLGSLSDERATRLVINALRDSDLALRQKTTRLLIKNSDVTLPPLIEALDSQDGDLQWRAVQVLGEIGDARTINPLRRTLRDNDADVRNQAVTALQ